MKAFLIFLLLIQACTSNYNSSIANDNNFLAEDQPLLEEDGNSISTRFLAPAHYYRKPAGSNSFATYLRDLPLKPVGTPVRYFNGQTKPKPVHEAVISIDIGNRDLQQCADAIMRLKAEYFFKHKQYDSISFLLTNNFRMRFSKWSEGYRLAVNGNKTNWEKREDASKSYKTFREYMDVVFMYAGTISLSKQLNTKSLSKLSIGDVFIVGGSPGHAVIVVDKIENSSGEKKVMLAQSYMPAQEIHVLKNFQEPGISPWYTIKEGENLKTPEWTFASSQLKGW